MGAFGKGIRDLTKGLRKTAPVDSTAAQVGKAGKALTGPTKKMPVGVINTTAKNAAILRSLDAELDAQNTPPKVKK